MEIFLYSLGHRALFISRTFQKLGSTLSKRYSAHSFLLIPIHVHFVCVCAIQLVFDMLMLNAYAHKYLCVLVCLH